MSTTPVSILIPNYNYAQFLPETLESVLKQDYAALEIIIADDASTDTSHKICQAYAKKDSRIRYHRHPRNLGMVANWNWCLQQASGAYIRLLMADDLIYSPTAISRMADILDTHPHVALVTSARKRIDENAQPLDPFPLYRQTSGPITGAEWIQEHLSQSTPDQLNSIGEPSAVLFRKETAKRGFDESLRQLVDLEMWLYILQQGDLYYINEPLCAFRVHPDQQTEVNRQHGIHRVEQMELHVRYSPAPHCNSKRYHTMRRMQKEKHPKAHSMQQQLQQEFGPLGMISHAIRYRINRLRFNMHRLCKPK